MPAGGPSAVRKQSGSPGDGDSTLPPLTSLMALPGNRSQPLGNRKVHGAGSAGSTEGGRFGDGEVRID